MPSVHFAFQPPYLLDNAIALIKKKGKKTLLYEQYGMSARAVEVALSQVGLIYN